jgi:chaperonin GroEL (HSP60 family)
MFFIFIKVLAQNSGYDLQETLIKIQTKHAESKELLGIDLNTGKKLEKKNSYLLKRLLLKDPHLRE